MSWWAVYEKMCWLTMVARTTVWVPVQIRHVLQLSRCAAGSLCNTVILRVER